MKTTREGKKENERGGKKEDERGGMTKRRTLKGRVGVISPGDNGRYAGISRNWLWMKRLVLENV